VYDHWLSPGSGYYDESSIKKSIAQGVYTHDYHLGFPKAEIKRNNTPEVD